jgi:dipeptide/tripeptide permease
MSAYFTVAAVFMVFGFYIFALCRWWFRHLTDLAARFDIPERRRRATRRYFIVLLFVAVPMLAAILGCFVLAPKIGIFVVAALICSIVPAMIWWFRRMPSLYALGYGRQK